MPVRLRSCPWIRRVAAVLVALVCGSAVGAAVPRRPRSPPLASA
ncbi:MAG TPA: hypothetical protein VG871_05345 [Vicinamibacterales bacterium]|nr:hypothetical protein [Vicinamibacterales bacterium]